MEKDLIKQFLFVLACIAFYNVIVRQFTPTPIQNLIGI